jgi:hypothetical protein
MRKIILLKYMVLMSNHPSESSWIVGTRIFESDSTPSSANEAVLFYLEEQQDKHRYKIL